MHSSELIARRSAPLSFRGAIGLLRPVPAPVRVSARPADPSVLRQELFRGTLCRERKRAERFEEPFLLLTVSLGANRARGTVVAVTSGMAAIRQNTDVLGWLKKDCTLGLIVPCSTGRSTPADHLAAQAREALAARLDASVVATLAIDVRLESGIGAARMPVALDAHPEIRTPAQKAGVALSHAAKRVMDLLGSAALLLLSVPVLVVVAALVKLTSSGPVLFRQERLGWTGRPFTMLKFRTMRAQADSAIHQQYVTQFIKSNEAANRTGGDAAFKIANDPRVTPIGHVLRKTSLDELPQLWNVFRGEMSLVGPRPPLRYEVDQYQRWHRLRVLEAKPGMTGLWQVVGRSRTTFDEMVRLDVRYARTRTLWTDVKILLATPRAVVSGKGAC
jgi:lipopolysaccharide/colanic/teichoic acid biosynthesis glycosyltransferase